MSKFILYKVLLILACFYTNAAFSQDTDGDGIEDFYDLDDDNDGILDSDEGTTTTFTELEIVQLPNHIDSSSLELIFDGLNSYTGNQDLRIHSFNVTAGDLNGSVLDNALVMSTTGGNVLPAGSFFTLSLENDDVAGDSASAIASNLVSDLTALGLDPNDLFQGNFNDVGPAGLDASDFDRDGDGKVDTAGVDFSPMGAILQYYDGDPNAGGALLNTSFSQIELFQTGGVYLHSVVVNAPLTHFVVASLPDGTGKDIRVNEIQINGSVNNGLVDGKMGFTTFFFVDSDSDGFYNHIDIDSDSDGIPDNVEAQTTLGYIVPSGIYDASGVDTAYPGGLQPVDTDKDGIRDFLDLNSDNDGYTDIQENGMADTSTAADVDDDGLNNAFETNGVNDAAWDVNEDIENPSDLSILPDADGDLFSGGDLDYRDLFEVNPPAIATIDFDGVDDYLESSLNLSGYDALTAMAWVRIDPAFSTTGNVLSHGDFGIQINASKIPVVKLNGEVVTLLAPSALVINQWAHIAIVFDSTVSSDKLKIYLNGEMIATCDDSALSSVLNTTTDAFIIGKNSFANIEYFKGDIDEVRVFKVALTESQLHKMIHQEILNNAGNVYGAIVPKEATDSTTNLPVSWSNLEAYYPMTGIVDNSITDFSSKGNTAYIHNISTIQEQTAPMPYIATVDGAWTSESTWLHGDAWDIETILENKPSSIVRLSANVSTSNSHDHLGLLIDSGKTLTVNGDNLINNSWYLELNGVLDLQNDSQLVQTEYSDLVTSAVGKVLRRQEGTSNVYRYNYWSSPVGALGVTSLSDNNAVSNNANNTPFTLNSLKDDFGVDIVFTNAYHQVGKVSSSWLYRYKKGLTYWDWAAISKNTPLEVGVGYTQKGTGNAGAEQQYIFEGKPNNGTILINVTDVGGSGSELAVSRTEYLLGNPYASAIDIHQFIDDNIGVIGGSIQLWEQWAGNSHTLDDYEGGYSVVSKLGSVKAYQFLGFNGEHNSVQNGTKKPTRYVPVGQGFMVEIVADGNVEFNNTQRLFVKEADANGTYSNGSIFSKSSKGKLAKGNNSTSTMQKIRLEFTALTGAEVKRELLLGFSNYTTDAFDYGYDAVGGASSPSDLNLVLEGHIMSMQAYGAITSDKVVPLNFRSSGDHSFQINLSEIENIEAGQTIYLRDNLTGNYFDLRQGISYSFTASQGVFNSRFELVFQSESQLLNIEDAIETTHTIYYENATNRLYGKSFNATIGSVAIINMRGQTLLEFNKVSQKILSKGLKIPRVSAGVYLACFKAETGEVFTKKILIN
ncbi:LamG domain-containing protein [Mariniflexile sp. AS56]|uniref:LamG domain-containing protein n=1 Tax=Mariniflexile sp. AS56 TaxID=3063957 RepID=UPI0026E982AB|nr:LamG domain-containing protein [Mariniflexile sp. AS56]MDO7171059.1 LamG domain-containing protein [Mariniflexile sp. AS56]